MLHGVEGTYHAASVSEALIGSHERLVQLL